MGTTPSYTKRIALNGILIAIVVILLVLASVVPTNRLSVYALSSVFVSMVIVEFGTGNGWVFYIASTLLALLVVPSRLEVIPYAIFFGLYGIIKFYIEKINKISLEIILKLVFFNTCLGAAFLLIREFFMYGIETSFPWWIVIIGLEIAFIIYDYIYTLFINFYRQRIRKFIS